MISKNKKEFKRRMKRNEQLVREQQKLIGGERFAWKDVENYEVYQSIIESEDDVEVRNYRIGNICDINKLSFLPKPIEVSPRQQGLTSRGKGYNCHSNVLEIVDRFGGEHIVGYELMHWFRGVVLNGHSIWKTPEGKFVDVSMMHSKGGIQVPRPRNSLFIPLCRAKDNLMVNFHRGKIVCIDDYVGIMQQMDVLEINQFTGKGIVPETNMRFRNSREIKRLILGFSFDYSFNTYRNWELDDTSFSLQRVA